MRPLKGKFAQTICLTVLVVTCLASTQILAQNQTPDYEQLKQINQDYLNSYVSGNAQRFDEILAQDYRETATDGTILNKSEFLAKIAAASNAQPPEIEALELEIRIFEDLAIVHAVPQLTLQDGTTIARGRYTDVYARIDGVWLCVAAHLGG
ncbi:MAG: hypothetical protein DHS20C12_00160 [Pseudohongiella sp.]|nr:MAG: hypothetical protein DHS20C12_00160 [Pseudohongiella sp.]